MIKNPLKLLVPSLSSLPRYLLKLGFIQCVGIFFYLVLRVYSLYLQEYNATIEFYWAPFLLESNSDDAIVHRISDRVVRKGSINKHGRHWKNVDIIVFNTYLWWMTGLKMKIL